MKHVPRRTAEQALKHEVAAQPASAVVDDDAPLAVDPDPTITTADGSQWPILQQAQTPSVALRAVTTEDVDQLWDWYRADAEGVKAFFGRELQNSRELFTVVSRLATMEQQGIAWMQAMTRDAALAGFVLIAPIQRPANQPPVGTVHLYIAPSERGDLPFIVSGMLAAFDASQPPMTLVVVVQRPEWMQVLEPLGFIAETVLTRPAAVMVNTHGT